MSFEGESEGSSTPRKMSASQGNIVKKKATWRKQKFTNKWLEEWEFRGWLAPHENKYNAQCTCCNKVLKAAKNALMKHKDTIIHKKNEAKAKDFTKLDKEFTTFKSNKSTTDLMKTSSNEIIETKPDVGVISMDESVLSDENENVVVTDIESSDVQSPREYETQSSLFRSENNDDSKIQMRIDEAYSLLRPLVHSKNKRDDCEVYGELVAMKLRKLDDTTRDIAMNKIDNLLFEMKMHPNKCNFVEKRNCQYLVLPQEIITSLSHQTTKQSKFTNMSSPSTPASSNILPTTDAHDS
ncbi:hypothetical protein Avbf_01446 [Armadillidium vulgare]|nr:hypothetical protein Avbf_01446 [Armadillidium vulgare]